MQPDIKRLHFTPCLIRPAGDHDSRQRTSRTRAPNSWRRWERKYATDGELQFTLPDVLKVPPISKHGNVAEIAQRFGGIEKLGTAVNLLQSLLYAA